LQQIDRLMTFTELLKSIYDSSKDRMKTPISGAYVLAFVVWNWRPIFLLIFEETSITNKIIVINDKYCNLMAIAGPILLALIFTIGIPYLTVIINRILKDAKKNRIEGIYSDKIDSTNEKIKLAVKELELQDVLSRSREKEEFLIKINELEKQLVSNDESNTMVVHSLNDQITALKNLQKVANTKFTLPDRNAMTKSELEMWTLVASSNLNLNEISELQRLPNITVTKLNTLDFSDDVLQWLFDNDLIIDKDDEYFPTADGLRLKKLLNFQ